MKHDTLDINGTVYPVVIYLEERRNYSASIGKRSINIRIPLAMSRDEQFKAIFKMKQWARQKLEERPRKMDEVKTYHDGEKISVGDKEYVLSIVLRPGKTSSARIKADIISMTISSDFSEELQKRHISSLLSRVVARQRLPVLEEMLHRLNDLHFHAKFNKIFFKNLRSRWGSCSKNGNINISTRLLFAPKDVLEYVCIHELAHLLEFNHSERFWSLVTGAMPTYMEKEKWLKEHGANMTF